MGAWNLLEQPQASGTPSRLSAAVERPQGYFVLFVGRRYYLRPIILWNARSAIGTALRASGTRLGAIGTALGQWNALRPLEQSRRLYLEPRRGLVKNHYYTRATHGIVEVMWSNRGAFVERGFLSGVPRELCSNGERRRCGALQVSDPGRDFR